MARAPQKPVVPETIHQLRIPDELFAWGSEPANVIKFNADWVADIRAILPADERVLTKAETQILIARLDGLVSEALRFGREDLLFGMDLYLTEWLGIAYRIPTVHGILEVSRNGPWRYSELRALIDVKEASAIAYAFQVKEIVSGIFPESVIGEIHQERDQDRCASCGRGEFTVMVTTDAGKYCRKCWSEMASSTSSLPS